MRQERETGGVDEAGPLHAESVITEALAKMQSLTQPPQKSSKVPRLNLGLTILDFEYLRTLINCRQREGAGLAVSSVSIAVQRSAG